MPVFDIQYWDITFAMQRLTFARTNGRRGRLERLNICPYQWKKNLLIFTKYGTKGPLERLAYHENRQTNGKSPGLKRPNRRISDPSNADYFSSHSARTACSLKDWLIFRKRRKGLLERRTKASDRKGWKDLARFGEANTKDQRSARKFPFARTTPALSSV